MQVKAFSVRRPRVEMVPLIDMFFLLLVFFIYGVFSMSMHEGLVVDLPQAKTAAPDPKEQALAISITADGQIVAASQPVALESLGSWLRQQQALAHYPMASINADKAAQHGIVMSVLDQLRQAGIRKVSFQTQPSP